GELLQQVPTCGVICSGSTAETPQCVGGGGSSCESMTTLGSSTTWKPTRVNSTTSATCSRCGHRNCWLHGAPGRIASGSSRSAGSRISTRCGGDPRVRPRGERTGYPTPARPIAGTARHLIADASVSMLSSISSRSLLVVFFIPSRYLTLGALPAPWAGSVKVPTKNDLSDSSR